jgi:membrane-associated phospholipid phosphatase
VRLPRARLATEAALAALGTVVFVALAQAYVNGGQVVGLDDDVAREMAEGLPRRLEWAARGVTYLGGAVGTTIVTALVVLVLWRAGRSLDAGVVVFAVVGISLLVAALKAVYERARPDGGSPIPLPHSYSFPSGHAATATVLYGLVGVLLAERASTRLRAAAWLGAATVLALAIGWSRVLLNVHFVSDVVAGFAVGLAWLCCCLIVRDFLVAREEAPAAAGSYEG